jgi:chemotaxis protein methyltransferase CheR
MKNLYWTLLTSEEHKKLEEIVEATVGFSLRNNKKDFIENLLIKRFSELQVSNFDSYYKILKSNRKEFSFLINKITNVSTYFFREKHHFEYLSTHVLPNLIASEKKIRLWSAGCSTGEEPYSIAMMLFGSIADISQYDIKILATDVNTVALEIAKMGLYNEDQYIEKIDQYKKFFHIVPENGVNKIQMDNSLKKIISFNYLNLLDSSWPMSNLFDVIFCRNVIIYLKPEVTRKLFEKFDRLLKVGGILALGHSENLNQFQDRYISLGKTLYQKIG